MKHGYLIDMDGVLYRGPEPIPGAETFVRELRKRNIPFLFLTNNSQRTRRDDALSSGSDHTERMCLVDDEQPAVSPYQLM